MFDWIIIIGPSGRLYNFSTVERPSDCTIFLLLASSLLRQVIPILGIVQSNTSVSEVVFIETKEMHGFLVRGDRHNPKTKKEIESTLTAACDFFDKHYPGQTS